MLWCSLLLPDLPLEVYARAWSGGEASRPFAVASGGSRPRIVAANDAAREAGVKRGQPVAAALALVPALALRDRDAEAEARSLEAIATFALSFTSAASLAPPRTVLAEIGGSLKLFGGLDRLVDAIGRGLRARGHAPRIAVAPTPLAALVRARTRRHDPVLSTEALRAAIADVPLAALDPDTRTLETLAAAGVRTIGAAEALPRDGLARRFGGGLVDALDRAHGRVPDPRVPLDASAVAANLAFGTATEKSLDRDFVGYGQIRAVNEQIEKLGDTTNDKSVAAALAKYKSAVAPLQSGEDADSENLGDIGGVLSAIAGDLEGSDRAPTQPQREVAASANARLDRALKRWDSVQKGELAALNAALKSGGKAQIRVPAEDQVQLHDAPEGKDLP